MTVLTAELMTFQGVGMALAEVAAELVGVAGAVTGAGVPGTCAAYWRPGRSGGPKTETGLTVI